MHFYYQIRISKIGKQVIHSRFVYSLSTQACNTLDARLSIGEAVMQYKTPQSRRRLCIYVIQNSFVYISTRHLCNTARLANCSIEHLCNTVSLRRDINEIKM